LESLAKQIVKFASQYLEGAPLCAKELLHLGSRAAIDQALSRLVTAGTLMRAGRGLYLRPVNGQFGVRAPSTLKVIDGISSISGETITSHGAAAANALGLTTQVPMRSIFLTSGRNRQLELGTQKVELRHAPKWQLIYPQRIAGEVVRALAWLGPEKSVLAIGELRKKLSVPELNEVACARGRLPTWLAKDISVLVADA
jgi:Family of unknown function (DUF6088)